MRMKHKKLFFEPWIMYLAGPLYCFSEFPIAIYMAWESVSKIMLGDFRYMFTLLFSPAFAFCGVYLYKNMIGDRLDFLAVSSQCVRWIAFLKRSKELRRSFTADLSRTSRTAATPSSRRTARLKLRTTL